MLSARMTEKLARVARKFLMHSCIITSYIPVVVEGEPVLDEEGHPTYTQSLEDAVPCLFLWRDIQVPTAGGVITRKIPTLYLDNTYPIDEDNLVELVQSIDGTILLVSARIQTIDRTAESGNGCLTVCELESVVI